MNQLKQMSYNEYEIYFEIKDNEKLCKLVHILRLTFVSY